MAARKRTSKRATSRTKRKVVGTKRKTKAAAATKPKQSRNTKRGGGTKRARKAAPGSAVTKKDRGGTGAIESAIRPLGSGVAFNFTKRDEGTKRQAGGTKRNPGGTVAPSPSMELALNKREAEGEKRDQGNKRESETGGFA